MDDSFQSSFTSGASGSSFRILSPASQLPRSRPTSTVENHPHGWTDYQSPSHPGESSYLPPVAPKYVRSKPPPRVHKREVWRDIFLKSDGRDKAFKLMQYSIRVYLWFHAKTVSSLMGTELNKRLRSTMSGLSIVRKCLILFNWLTPLIEITNPPPIPFSTSPSAKHAGPRSILHRMLHASPPTLIDLFNGLADDTYTFHRLGLLPATLGDRASRIADWLWFLSTLAGIVEVETDATAVSQLASDLAERMVSAEEKGGGNEAEEGLEKLGMQSRVLKITRWKLYMDLVFVSYEVFRVKRWREPVLAFSGLASAVLSSWKIYDKHHIAIAKTLRSEAT